MVKNYGWPDEISIEGERLRAQGGPKLSAADPWQVTTAGNPGLQSIYLQPEKAGTDKINSRFFFFPIHF